VRAGPRRARRFDIADIDRDHRAELESAVRLTREQKRVLTDIAQCRTAALGGHVDCCRACGYEHPAYNSCRNRHCPKCQALAQEKWIAERRARMLDVRHFHVVFTLPAQLRRLARFAPRTVYAALLRCAERVLLDFSANLSATIGATLVLHTWRRDLQFHPHVHAIVTGGGLSFDEHQWCPGQRRFLFPVAAMRKVLRGKMLAELRAAYDEHAFDGFNDFRDPEGFERLVRTIATIDWHVYSKPSFDTGENVLAYLGRYTHRVGIANSRLLHADEHSVTFRTKGAATETVTPVEFLRRLILHVLPGGFHKIRHIGLYAAAASRKREVARQLLGQLPVVVQLVPWRDRFFALTGRDLSLCPRCGDRLLSVAVERARAPPEAA